MVSLADNRSFLLASCCNVLVVKGGTGLRIDGFSSTLTTFHLSVINFSASSLDSSSLSNMTSRPDFNNPVDSSKSLPVATLLPPIEVILTSHSLPSFSNFAFKSQ